jgi:hypothetical protein
VLRQGPWYGYFADSENKILGAFTADVQLDGNLQIRVEGRLSDMMTPLVMEANAAVLREGSNFNITGTEGNRSVSGYGRERVFDTLLELKIPIDNVPAHQLSVGSDFWGFQIVAGVDVDSVVGSWETDSQSTGEIITGMLIAQPGELPPPDAMDLDAPMDAPGDAPGDAGTD